LKVIVLPIDFSTERNCGAASAAAWRSFAAMRAEYGWDGLLRQLIELYRWIDVEQITAFRDATRTGARGAGRHHRKGFRVGSTRAS
jgi:hypothetical protein